MIVASVGLSLHYDIKFDLHNCNFEIFELYILEKENQKEKTIIHRVQLDKLNRAR